MKPIEGQFRQGDVLIERIPQIPKSAKKQKRARRVILAHGEATGHHHALITADPADWWKDGEIATSNEKPSVLVGEVFVAVPNGGVVTHDEHYKNELPPDNYRVIRQREYHPVALRNVAD